MAKREEFWVAERGGTDVPTYEDVKPHWRIVFKKVKYLRARPESSAGC